MCAPLDVFAAMDTNRWVSDNVMTHLNKEQSTESSLKVDTSPFKGLADLVEHLTQMELPYESVTYRVRLFELDGSFYRAGADAPLDIC